ncbi:uncharacterized protein [Epargyreus clarus]|uniref:uncharacterized protein n=1 Tax=Epargyreus clarus TaxID=520877 RepID=UPI003C2B2389
MSLQRTRPIDTLQRIMSSFKHFEKKLDKLQEDVDYHGHTLSELRVMVANLSAGTMMTPDTHIESMKRSVNNTAIQYDERFHIEEPPKTKRKSALQPFPSKIKAKSLQSQKYGVKRTTDAPYRINKLPSSPKSTGKHFARHRKVETPCKATMLRAQKALENKLMVDVEN